MNRSISAAMTMAMASLATAGPAARAQAIESLRCSNAALRGDYAFTIDGQVFPPGAPVVDRRGVALTHFDGHGGLTQTDFVMQFPDKSGGSSPVPGTPNPTTGFNTGEQGHYVVFADCSGELEIDFPPLDAGGAVIKARFVLSADGRVMHTVVYSVQPPFSPKTVPAIIRSEGRRLDLDSD